MAGHRLAKILISRSSWFESLSNLGSMVNAPKPYQVSSWIRVGCSSRPSQLAAVLVPEDKLARFNLQSKRNKTRHISPETHAAIKQIMAPKDFN